MECSEQTFLLLKPDAVQRGLVGEIIQRFERKGFQLVGLKFVLASEEILRQHYAALASKPFFPSLLEYMQMGPVVAMVWQGLEVVRTARQMLGETNPATSSPGTIRADFAIQTGRNVIHGSDSVDTATREIDLWFEPDELVTYTLNQSCFLYETT